MTKLQNEISQILTTLTIEIDNAQLVLSDQRIKLPGNIQEFVRLRTVAHLRAQIQLENLFNQTTQ